MRRIPVRNRAGRVRAYALVSREDAASVAVLRWSLDSHGYIVHNTPRAEQRHGAPRKLYLHRFLVGLLPGDPREVDHRNRNRWDCRRHNLRVASRAQNQQNRTAYRGSSSHYRGVCWDPRRGKWRATVVIAHRQHSLGAFASERAAAQTASEFRANNMSYTVEGDQ